jgi:hypothetical protein
MPWLYHEKQDMPAGSSFLRDTMQEVDLERAENCAIPAAIRALRYLANHDRPGGGEQFPNSECCWMIADELEEILDKYRGVRK